MRPFLRLFFDQLLTLNTDKTPAQDPSLNVPVLLMLDEFARLGHMKALAEAAQFIRGYGLRLALVVQNKAQLKAIYGNHGAADIFDNLGAEIVYGTTDLELAQELEKAAGRRHHQRHHAKPAALLVMGEVGQAVSRRTSASPAADAGAGAGAAAGQRTDHHPAWRPADADPENAMVHGPELHVTGSAAARSPAARCSDHAGRRQHANLAEAAEGHERAG
jgi:hypothetical protein